MIRSLALQNFKCFERQALAFGPWTLLAGLNGTGKSSVLQSLLLLRQSWAQGVLKDRGLALNGELVHLGTGVDALFEGASDETIGFDLILDQGLLAKWRFVYDSGA